ncbi:MAG TPA: hypothetical protein VLH75_08400 [Longimicrobiales bacterium]|nr:hypothetical protein [Longimicrobiales bacterium]
MILKRYGTSYQSVDPNFDSKALNEVGFRRDQELAIPVAEFQSGYEHVASHEISAEAEGHVQDHTEQLLLDRLEARLLELEGGLEGAHVLVLENGDGTDYPKTRQEIRTVVEGGENKLHFRYTVAPPLRMGVYRKKA